MILLAIILLGSIIAARLSWKEMQMNEDKVCLFCGHSLWIEKVDEHIPNVHEGCLADMLYDEWMAEVAAQEYEDWQWESITS